MEFVTYAFCSLSGEMMAFTPVGSIWEMSLPKAWVEIPMTYLEHWKLPRKSPDIGFLNKAASFVLASETGTACPRSVCQVSGIKLKGWKSVQSKEVSTGEKPSTANSQCTQYHWGTGNCQQAAQLSLNQAHKLPQKAALRWDLVNLFP